MVFVLTAAETTSNPTIQNGNVASRETINHVRHQHQQTIGNVHVVTEIDIKNIIAILNGSEPINVNTFVNQSNRGFVNSGE